MEQKIKGGTIVGLVGEPKPVEEEAPKTEDAPKKRTRKTKGESE